MKKVYLLFVFLLCGCTELTTQTEQSYDTKEDSLVENRSFSPFIKIESHLITALNSMELIKNKDFSALSSRIHPSKGVRFSPYGHINVEKDLLFSNSELPFLYDSEKVFNFGVYDGSGMPIELTFAKYYERFIYDLDFLNPNVIGNNTIIRQGNMNNNIKEVYQGSVFVEFHFKGVNPEYEEMDWRSLIIVLELHQEVYYIAGIIHDEWTT